MVEGGFGIILGTVAEATSRCSGGVLSPKFEAAFYSQGGEEVGIDGGRQPLELWVLLADAVIRMFVDRKDELLLGFLLRVQSRYHKASRFHPYSG